MRAAIVIALTIAMITRTVGLESFMDLLQSVGERGVGADRRNLRVASCVAGNWTGRREDGAGFPSAGATYAKGRVRQPSPRSLGNTYAVLGREPEWLCCLWTSLQMYSIVNAHARCADDVRFDLLVRPVTLPRAPAGALRHDGEHDCLRCHGSSNGAGTSARRTPRSCSPPAPRAPDHL